MPLSAEDVPQSPAMLMLFRNLVEQKYDVSEMKSFLLKPAVAQSLGKIRSLCGKQVAANPEHVASATGRANITICCAQVVCEHKLRAWFDCAQEHAQEEDLEACLVHKMRLESCMNRFAQDCAKQSSGKLFRYGLS